MFQKNSWMFTIQVFTTPKKNQIQTQIHTEIKRTNPSWRVSKEDKSEDGSIHIWIFLFCFSMCISNFGLNFLQVADMCLLNTRDIFSEKNDMFKFECIFSACVICMLLLHDNKQSRREMWMAFCCYTRKKSYEPQSWDTSIWTTKE